MVHIIQQILGHNFPVPYGKKIDLHNLAEHLSQKDYAITLSESASWFLHCRCFDADICIPASGKANIRTAKWAGREYELEKQLNNFYREEIKPFLITNGVKLRKSRTRKR